MHYILFILTELFTYLSIYHVSTIYIKAVFIILFNYHRSNTDAFLIYGSSFFPLFRIFHLQNNFKIIYYISTLIFIHNKEKNAMVKMSEIM